MGRLIVCSLILFLAPLLTAGLFIPNFGKQALVSFLFVKSMLAILGSLLFFAGVFGHGLSLALRKPATGRACECTTFFVACFGGILSATFGYLIIPDKAPDPVAFVVGWSLFFFGFTVFALFVLTECNREAKRSERRKAGISN